MLAVTQTAVIENILAQFEFTAEEFTEDNGSVTLSLNEIDLIENGKNKEEAINKMAAGILEYSQDYYNDFDFWYSAPNRRSHLPYVLKALLLNDVEKIGGLITCRLGEI